MIIIPVLDLQGGLVVRAAGGDRAAYRPIETPLSATAEPADVVAGFLRLAPFETVYVADLDAIMGGTPQTGLIAELAARFPHVCFWADAGLRTEAGLAAIEGLAGVRPVAGSETLAEAALLARPGLVLSLDFRRGAFLGEPEILQRAERWPRDVIVMSLDAVGAGRGPDCACLSDVIARAQKRRVFAAGGIRDEADLERIAGLGAAGALVSTALHAGTVGPGGLSGLRSP